MKLAERFDQWAEEHRQEGWLGGLSAGHQEGEALVLQRLLVQRFGALPDDVARSIRSASAADLDTWLDQLLDAPSLEAVFRRY